MSVSWSGLKPAGSESLLAGESIPRDVRTELVRVWGTACDPASLPGRSAMRSARRDHRRLRRKLLAQPTKASPCEGGPRCSFEPVRGRPYSSCSPC
jgi:hypothetical protein